MKRAHKGIPTRHTCRKGRIPYRLTRPVPALLTWEAANLVLIMVSDRQRHGWRLDQIGWQRYCRDSAVINLVTQQLKREHTHRGEV